VTAPSFDQLVRALVATGTERPNAERLARRTLANGTLLRIQARGTMDVADERSRSEHEHQVALFTWADEHLHRWPELALLFAIPNFHGRLGRLTAKHGAYLKAEGRKRGVPDICLPVARAQFHGLYIELKRIGGKPDERQLEWRAQLRAQGYRAEIVEGWHAARDLLVRYLDS
jgi:hypothetical protein